MKEGIYQMEVLGQQMVVQILLTLLGQWPDKRERLMVHFISGPPRFPWPLEEMVKLEAKFTPA